MTVGNVSLQKLSQAGGVLPGLQFVARVCADGLETRCLQSGEVGPHVSRAAQVNCSLAGRVEVDVACACILVCKMSTFFPSGTTSQNSPIDAFLLKHAFLDVFNPVLCSFLEDSALLADDSSRFSFSSWWQAFLAKYTYQVHFRLPHLDDIEWIDKPLKICRQNVYQTGNNQADSLCL